METDSQERELAFWNRLAEIVSGTPNTVREIEPGFIPDLIAKVGRYNPDLLMNS